MSRRRRKVKSGASVKRGGVGLKVFGSVVALLLVVVVVGYNRVVSYIHSDEFRDGMSEKVGDLMGVDGEFGQFEWSGMHGKNEGFVAKSDGALVSIEGESIQMDVDVNFVRRDVWKLRDVQVGTGRVEVDLRKDFNDPIEREAKAEGFLEKWLPKKAELVNAEVSRAGALLRTEGGDYEVKGVQVDVKAARGGYFAKLSGGEVSLPYDILKAAEFREGEVLFLDNRLAIDRAEFDFFDSGKLNLDGEIDFNKETSGYLINGVLSGLKCSDVISEDWKQKLKGDLSGRFIVKPQSGKEPLIRGAVKLVDGTLTALPVLDHVAAFTRVRDFKKLKIAKFSCDFKKYGELLELSNMELHCDRLMRIEGDLSVRGEKLAGRFEVGLMPGVLRHIPGAEEKVFLRGKDGMSWASVEIGGTVDNMTEDLTGRMIAAAGERMFEMFGGKQILRFGGAALEAVPSAELTKDAG